MLFSSGNWGWLVAVSLGGGVPRSAGRFLVPAGLPGVPEVLFGGEPGVVGPQCGVVRSQGGVVAAEVVGVLFQAEDLADPREVDPVGHQLGDAPRPAQVVLAEPPGAAVGAGRSEQPVPLEQP
jgi:hypothetical protein